MKICNTCGVEKVDDFIAIQKQPPFGGFLTSKIYKLICIIDCTINS